MAKYKKSLFIFRRDLRLSDNTALIQALKDSEKVIPIFIFTPQQIKKNEYRSDAAIQFMIESLEELADEIKKKGGELFFFFDDVEKVINKLLKSEKIEAIFVNQDYTPFAKKRDAGIEKICKNYDIDFYGLHDLLLIGNPDGLKTGSDGFYTVYSPFMKAAKSRIKVNEPQRFPSKYNFIKVKSSNLSLKQIEKKIDFTKNKQLAAKGGASQAEKIVRRLEDFSNYKKDRDILAKDGTTVLSAHHKFGTISIREVYWEIKQKLGLKGQDLINELYWRDFFTYISDHFPHVYKGAFREKYDDIKWSASKKNFEAWCEGKTGFPIVDAGMRQLNEIGWMHNRVRMITASFLVKDLHINWQWGEKYFAQKLVDYDPAVNNGNWQWVAGTGCDAAPYFRIFNPWTQQKKFDADAAYIKKWVPELRDLDVKAIHNWHKEQIDGIDYPAPMIDHAKARKETLSMYKKISD